MGMVAFREKRWAEAGQWLQRYLEQAANDPEAGFAQQILDKVAAQLAAPATPPAPAATPVTAIAPAEAAH
jgi:hypothetical protein